MTARWWSREGEGIRCDLCPHRCLLPNGRTGICRSRRNIDGEMKSLAYGKVCASAFDPIEKKPIFHYRPGTRLFSLGTYGCNLSCDNCQNYVLAWAKDGEIPCETLAPEEVVQRALERMVQGLAFTFNEPIVWLEFILDAAELARNEGLYTVMNTNGFITESALTDALPLIDVMNIDVKAFSEEFYESTCGGNLETVLRTCLLARESGVHIELTYLLIPGMNDSNDEIISFFDWVVENMGQETPVHLFRFLPSHRLSNVPAQDMKRMDEAFKLAKEAGILYPYVAGVVGDERQSTFCPNCGTILVKRRSVEPTEKVVVKSDEVSRFCPTYPEVELFLENDSCPQCGLRIALKK